MILTKRITSVFFSFAVTACVFSGLLHAKTNENAHQLYMDNCASCHGADHGGYLAPH